MRMVMKRKKYRIMKSRNRAFLAFLAPSLSGVLLFVLLPYADVIRRSFLTAVTGEQAGMENYRMIFTNSAFLLAVKNTFRFTGVCIPVLVLLGLAIALPLAGMKGARVIKSFYLFPLAMPTATIVLVWKMLFYEKGFVNKYLLAVSEWLGAKESIGVDYLNTEAAFYVLAGTYIWKNLGYTIVLWLAGILGVKEDMLEAARVDGAGRWQRLVYVLLPNLKGSLYTIVVLSFLNSFKIYREAYLVAGAYPHESIYMLQHLFNNWFVNMDLDKMAAAAVVCGIFLCLFILLLQRLWEKSG